MTNERAIEELNHVKRNVKEFTEDLALTVAIEALKRKDTGRWEINEYTYAGILKNWKCTNCCTGKYDFIITSITKPTWNYCPNCGAKMEGDLT